MADQTTEITGVSLDGDSMWATERVQEQLLEALIKLGDLTAKQQKELEDGFKDMKETGKVTKDNLKAQKTKGGGGDLFGDSTKGLASFTGEVVGAADDLDDLASGPMKKFGKGMTGLVKNMGMMGGLAAGLMAQIGAAVSTIKETVDAMRDLNSVGITLEDGFLGFQEMLEDSGSTLAELSNITTQYARTVGNVGLKSLVNMTKAAEGSEFAFKNYGLRLLEATEFQAEMLDADRLAGIFRKRDEVEQSMMLQDNIKTLTAYSKVLNVSREDMIKQRVELKSRADVQRRFNSMTDEGREAASASFDQFSDIMAALGPQASGLTQLMTDIIADPAAVNTEAFTQLAGASPEAAAAIRQLKEQIEAGEDISPDMIINRLLTPLDAASKSGQLEMLSMNEAIGSTVDLLGGPVLNSLRNWESRIQPLIDEGLTQEQALAKLAESTDSSVQKATEAQTELDIFAATVKNARVKVFENLLGKEASNIMDLAIDGLRIASDKISEYSSLDYRGMLGNLVDQFELYVVEPFRTSMTWLNDVVDSLGKAFDEFFIWLQDIPARIWNAMAAVLPIDPVDLPSAASTYGWTAAPGAPTKQEVSAAYQTSEVAKQAAETADPTRAEEMELLRETAEFTRLAYEDAKKRRFLNPNGQTEQ